jgi:hypothetical protein
LSPGVMGGVAAAGAVAVAAAVIALLVLRRKRARQDTRVAPLPSSYDNKALRPVV